TLHRGRTMAIVGESGSGKSTLARAVTGLLAPRSGRIAFDGAELSPELRQRSRDQRRRIQMIYQMADTALNPRQRIRDIIGRPVAFYHGLDARGVRARVDQILDMIGLPRAFAERVPSELSGGQKQRIGIARALAADPDVIICDEVTSALDRVVAEDILNLLLSLRRERGLSYLFITHDLETVKDIADDIVVMRGGRVVDSGLKGDVFSAPLQPYTQLLLDSIPEMRIDWLDERIAAGQAREGRTGERNG
ncbi:MAG TPA: ATP-binding cassette domain-containing protein, partial [Paenirhodobacter sp.]